MKSVIPLLLALVHIGSGNLRINQRSYTKMPTNLAGTTFDIFTGAAQEAAYDPTWKYMYIIGDETNILHVVDIHVPTAPVFAYKKQFDINEDGQVLDVEVCGDKVAFSFKGRYAATEGHVELYSLVSSPNPDLVKLGPSITVGVYPDNIQFTPDCQTIVVANEGRPGYDGFPSDPLTKFKDPEGTVTVIDLRNIAVPVRTTIDFTRYNEPSLLNEFLNQGGRYVWRGDHSNGPEYVNNFSQDLEPEYVTITDDGNFAYVTLQENNGLAKIDLHYKELKWLQGLGKKDWNQYEIDVSDRDNGVNRARYNVSSFYMPDVAEFIILNNVGFIITLDEGAERTMGETGVTFTDTRRAQDLYTSDIIDKYKGVGSATLAECTNTAQLGRLYLGANDGIDCIYSTMTQLSHFGGRGFSMWEDLGSSTAPYVSQYYSSGGDIELHLEQEFPTVFNSRATSKNVLPTASMDSQSPLMGPKLSDLAYGTFNGRDVLLIGDENSNAIFVYSFNVNVPRLESVYRAGNTDLSWMNLYNNGNQAGDMGISDMGFIQGSDSPTGQPIIYVIGGLSGTMSLYELEDTA